MKNFILTGVKKGHFGVTDVKIDSRVLSLKKWGNLTGVNLMRIGVTKKKLASKQPDWRHGKMKWRQIKNIWRYYHKISGLKGGSGYSPTRFAFRAHEMRILRRSIERPLSEKEGETDGKTKRRKHAPKAFQADRRNSKTVS